MARTIRNTGKQTPRIRTTGSREPLIDSQTVAEALGGALEQQVPRTSSPITLSLVREELARTLKSTGGRPAITGTDRRFKIPLSDAQLRALEEVAVEVTSPGFSPSPGQIASVLVSLGLRGIERG
jgi:hypothetical protein